MKQLLLLLLCLIGICQPAFSQNESSGEWALSVMKGTSTVYRMETLEGAGSYDGEGAIGAGLHYLKPLNNWLALETGVFYAKNRVSYTSAMRPDRGRSFASGNLHVLSAPLLVRVHFLRNFFVNAGPVVDFQLGEALIDNQTGIGAMAGVGFKYHVSTKTSLFVNPYVQQHAFIPFQREDYHLRLLTAGVRLGVGLQL